MSALEKEFWASNTLTMHWYLKNLLASGSIFMNLPHGITHRGFQTISLISGPEVPGRPIVAQIKHHFPYFYKELGKVQAESYPVQLVRWTRLVIWLFHSQGFLPSVI